MEQAKRVKRPLYMYFVVARVMNLRHVDDPICVKEK